MSEKGDGVREGFDGRDGGSGTVAESMDGRRERQFRLGGLTLELSGVTAEIEELALGVEPIELGVSAPADSKTAEDEDGGNGRESHGRNARLPAGRGARLGAFLGREIGRVLGRILDRGVHVLWNRVRTRGEKTDGGQDVEMSESGSRNGGSSDFHEFDEELLARLGRVADKESSEE